MNKWMFNKANYFKLAWTCSSILLLFVSMSLLISTTQAAVLSSGISVNSRQAGADCTSSSVNVEFDITGTVDDTGGGNIDNFAIFMEDGLGQLIFYNFEAFIETGQTNRVSTFVTFYQDPSGPFGGTGNIPLARPFTIKIVDDTGFDDPSAAPVIGSHSFDPAAYAPSCAGLINFGVNSSQSFGLMSAGTDYERAIAPNTAHIYEANLTTMPFKFDFQTRTAGLNHDLVLLDSFGNLVDTTTPHIDGRNILYNDSLPTGTYYIVVLPNSSAASGTYALTLWFTTYPLMSLDFPTNAHSTTALGDSMRWYFTCDDRCNPGYIRYELDAGDVVWNYTVVQRGGGTIATGSLGTGVTNIPLAVSSGTFDMFLERQSGTGSYNLRIFSGTPTGNPSVSGFEVIAQPALTELYIGENAPINFVALNPDQAPNGGIRGAELDCSVDSTVAQGISLTDGTAFSPQAIGTMWTPPFPNPSFGYLIAEDEMQPSVIMTAPIITVNYQALARGTTTVDCVANTIDGDGNYLPAIPYTSALIIVVGDGIIEGYVILADADATNAGVVVTISDGVTTIATATTDQVGYFSVTVPPGSNYEVEASASGYVRAVTSVVVPVQGDQTTTISTVALIGGNFNSIDDNIDLLDIVAYANAFGAQRTNSTLQFDITRDSETNLVDFYRAVQNYGFVGPVDWQP